jgi:hypothetical protein
MRKLLVALLLVSVVYGCKKKKDKEEEPPLTSQVCMDQNGPGWFMNSNKECEWAPALSICSTTDHWIGGYWDILVTPPGGGMPNHYTYKIDIEFFRNGSATSGTGKTRCGTGQTCSGPWVGNFSWKMDDFDRKTILITGSDTIFNKYCLFNSMTLISPSGALNATTFTTNLVKPMSTTSYVFLRGGGIF